MNYQILALSDILKQFIIPIRSPKLTAVAQQEHMVLRVAKILLTLAPMVSHNMRLPINVCHRITSYNARGVFLI
jgi:hypothetical protein